MEPEEAASWTTLVAEPFDQRMQRASDVFYDYVVNYAPELLSPQYASFFEAANQVKEGQKVQQETIQEASENYLEENQNVINLRTLSQTLTGLSEQALSYRRDVNKQDYLNKFYEQYLMPLEDKAALFNHEPRNLERATKAETILMERAYLKAWQQFKAGTASIISRFRDLVVADKDSLEGQLAALQALGACRLDEADTRNQIIDNASRLLAKATANVNNSAVVDGLIGLAQSPALNDKGRQLGQKLAEKLDVSTLSFSEQLDAIWSLCALQVYECKALKEGLKLLNTYNFERLDNDLRYEEYVKLIDIYNALKIEAPQLKLTNKGLVAGLEGQDHYLSLRFQETQTKYDPFKQRVVQALAKGLTNASVEHQVVQENELFQAQSLETDILNKAKYPYKPDIMLGFKGHKVGVFVLPETSTTRDTHQADGASRFRMRLLEKTSGAKLSALAVDDVVQYDIEGLKMELNPSFSFSALLEQQVPASNLPTANFSALSDFGSRFVPQAMTFIEGLTSEQDARKLDTLIQRLYQVIQTKQQNELRFEQSQRAAGYDEIRFQLMKLSLLFDTLDAKSRDFVDGNAGGSFKELLQQTLASIPKVSAIGAPAAAGLDDSWLGTRLEVELPVAKEFGASAIKKSILPEIINQRFMWVDDYFHYDDWRGKQKEVFDNFNLLVLPQNKDAEKYYFDRDAHCRRIPQGVFPFPNHKRQLMIPTANQSVVDATKNPNHDEYVLYEKEPFKMMVINELKKAETLKPIDEATSMITNLQNIKQGLKADYSDKELLNTILLNMNFTDQLIEEHLRGS